MWQHVQLSNLISSLRHSLHVAERISKQHHLLLLLLSSYQYNFIYYAVFCGFFLFPRPCSSPFLLIIMIMIMMMMMIMTTTTTTTTTTITIIAFKGAVRDFIAISSLRREPSPTRTLKWPGHNRVQITCNTSSAYHVQLVLGATWCEGTAQLLSLTELKSHLFELYFIVRTMNR